MKKKKRLPVRADNVYDESIKTKVLGQPDLSRFMVVPVDIEEYVLHQIGREWAARTEAEYTYASMRALEDEYGGE
jgi:hypothetical protein